MEEFSLIEGIPNPDNKAIVRLGFDGSNTFGTFKSKNCHDIAGNEAGPNRQRVFLHFLVMLSCCWVTLLLL